MKTLTQNEIAEVKKIFSVYNAEAVFKVKEDESMIKVGCTCITALEIKPLMKAGYLVAVYASAADSWHDLSLTVHVFKA